MVQGSPSTHHMSRACDRGIRQSAAAPHDAGWFSVDYPLLQRVRAEFFLASPFQRERHPLVANLIQYVGPSVTYLSEY